MGSIKFTEPKMKHIAYSPLFLTLGLGLTRVEATRFSQSNKTPVALENFVTNPSDDLWSYLDITQELVQVENICVHFQVDDAPGYAAASGTFDVSVKLENFDYLFNFTLGNSFSVNTVYFACGYDSIEVPSLNVEKVFVQGTGLNGDGVKIADFGVTVDIETFNFIGPVSDVGGWWIDTNSDETLYGPCVTGKQCELIKSFQLIDVVTGPPPKCDGEVQLGRICVAFQVANDDDSSAASDGDFDVAVKLQDLDYLFQFTLGTGFNFNTAYYGCGNYNINVPNANVEKVFVQANSGDGLKIAKGPTTFTVTTLQLKDDDIDYVTLDEFAATGPFEEGNGWWIDTDSDEAVYGASAAGKQVELIPIVLEKEE